MSKLSNIDSLRIKEVQNSLYGFSYFVERTAVRKQWNYYWKNSWSAVLRAFSQRLSLKSSHCRKLWNLYMNWLIRMVHIFWKDIKPKQIAITNFNLSWNNNKYFDVFVFCMLLRILKYIYLIQSIYLYRCDQAQLGMSKGIPNVQSAILLDWVELWYWTFAFSFA